MASYVNRVVDAEVEAALASMGAVLLEGPKAVGKTMTASRLANTVVRLDDGSRSIKAALNVDPKLLLVGQPPVLLDEWQLAPELWNLVRREVDDRRLPGQFILTGSATPDDDARRHSGAGRFAVIQMRPLSLFESGNSTGQVSLAALFDGDEVSAFDSQWDTSSAREQIADLIVAGGWPGGLGKSVDEAALMNRNYLTVIREYDIERVTGVARDPNTALKVMRSLARVVSTPAREATIARDVQEGEPGAGLDATSRPTVACHLDALARLRVIEDQPAWTPHIRSARQLRTSPKRHFIDPSLAAAALGLSAKRLAADPMTLGLFFESLAVRDLRVYAQALNGVVRYYRDDTKLEADAIIELPDGRWAGLEVKLGTTDKVINDAAQNLLKLAARVGNERLAFLAVITNSPIAHRRDDGVNVIPLRMLKP